MQNALQGASIRLPCTVHLTRIGPKKLDSDDNLNISFKAIRDAIAAKLGVDDGEDDKINFVYHQEPCKVRRYSIIVEIVSNLPPPLEL